MVHQKVGESAIGTPRERLKATIGTPTICREVYAKRGQRTTTTGTPTIRRNNRYTQYL